MSGRLQRMSLCGESWAQFVDTFYGDEVMDWDNSKRNIRLEQR